MRLLCVLGLVLAGPAAAQQFVGYESPSSTFPEFTAIDPAAGTGSTPSAYAGCFLPGVVFFASGGAGFISGISYDGGGQLYGIEWESQPDLHLFTISVDAGGCALATRVGALAIGQTGLESLAYCSVDGMLYTTTFVSATSPHRGRLVRLDPNSGLGTFVDANVFLPDDHNVTGMTCADDGTLWAVTGGFGVVGSMLLTIDRATGEGTPIGQTQQAPGEIQALAIDRSAVGAPPVLLAGGSALYTVNAGTGEAVPIAAGSFNKLWGIAFPVPEPHPGLQRFFAAIVLFAFSRLRARRGSQPETIAD